MTYHTIQGLLTVTVFSVPGAGDVVVRCPLNHIQCIGTRKCIHFNKLCNGAIDCEDGFDEGVHCRGKSWLYLIHVHEH